MSDIVLLVSRRISYLKNAKLLHYSKLLSLIKYNPQKPDYITVGGSSNKKLEAIDGAVDEPGTFTFDDETKKLSHLITGKGVDTTQDLKMDLKVYKCFYENCTDPHPKPLPTNPTILQRPETVNTTPS